METKYIQYFEHFLSTIIPFYDIILYYTVIQLGTCPLTFASPISQIVLKNFIKISLILECPEEILIKLANFYPEDFIKV